MRYFLCICLLTMLAACGSDTPSSPTPIIVAPQEDPHEILVPTAGMILYEEMLQLRGTTGTSNDSPFRLNIVTAMGDTLLDTEIQPEDGAWEYEFAHNYEGDPIELTIALLPVADTEIGEYDIIAVVLSPPDYRPDGNYAEIYQPAGGERVGGDVLIIQGVASGYETLKLTLQGDDTIISEQTITIFNGADSLNETPWLVELPAEGTTGRVSLYLYDESDTELDNVDILLDEIAG
ncbi:MAG: hypothetical protein ACPG7F_03090 [Aggregatilineales bacterium]